VREVRGRPRVVRAGEGSKRRARREDWVEGGRVGRVDIGGRVDIFEMGWVGRVDIGGRVDIFEMGWVGERERERIRVLGLGMGLGMVFYILDRIAGRRRPPMDDGVEDGYYGDGEGEGEFFEGSWSA
jgi:hypothetical protein